MEFKLGNTEVETLRLNNFVVGDILEGCETWEGAKPQRILITAIGIDCFLCKWDYKCDGEFVKETGSTTLSHRKWKCIGSIYRIGKSDFPYTEHNLKNDELAYFFHKGI